LFVRSRSSLDRSGDSPELSGALIFCQVGSRSSPDRDQATDSEIRNVAAAQVIGYGTKRADNSKNERRTQSAGAAEHQSRGFEESGKGPFGTKARGPIERQWIGN
jgi:hypothetical protein